MCEITGRTLPRHLLSLVAMTMAVGAQAGVTQQKSECRSERVETSRIEICLIRGAAFQHDLYELHADGALIFSLTDDYVEKVELQHTVPEGVSIEYPLSKQTEKVVKISGGCLPEVKNGLEIARVCNFHWGKHYVVKNQRFEFD